MFGGAGRGRRDDRHRVPSLGDEDSFTGSHPLEVTAQLALELTNAHGGHRCNVVTLCILVDTLSSDPDGSDTLGARVRDWNDGLGRSGTSRALDPGGNRGQGFVELGGILPARLREIGAASAPTADELRYLLDKLAGLEALG
jgi:hypothetical protein